VRSIARTTTAGPDEERHEKLREADRSEALLVWNARLASIRVRAPGRTRDAARNARDVSR